MPVSTATNTTNSQQGLPAIVTTTIFNENHENLHHIEFEAPPSADLDLEHRLQRAQDLAQHGRFSIDLSLELERQLNMESPPVTPGHDVTTHSVNAATGTDVHSSQHHGKPDPDVLAHIVTHMRKSLMEITKERDELVRMLTKANTQDANTRDALQLMTERVCSAEEELDVARKKIREDEEQIVLLRAKVEESRRGLMRLQTESRRQSMVPTDSARTSSLTLAAFGSPPKRASFTPLTGRPGHRRISSVSDTSFGSFPTPDPTPSPHAQAFNLPSPEPHLSSPPNSSHRFSGIFGHQLPPTASDLSTTTATELPQVPASNASAVNSEEIETLRKELQSVKDELVIVKHDLIEAHEAREASETCVKALREFIADNNVGVVAAGGASSSLLMKLPPPPTMTTGEEEPDRGKNNGGWGFKLWGVDSPLKSSMPFSVSMATPSPLAPAYSTSTLPLPPVIAAAPLSRKLGGFFSSRSSLSSNSSQQQHVPPLQMNAAGVQLPLQSHRDSSYSFSDTSSVAEPISPGSDIHGLGSGLASYVPESQGGYGSIVVKDVTNLDRVHTHALSVDDKDGIVKYDRPLTLPSSGSVDLDGLR
ncbi:hypothetical protein BYT27DRAFT_7115385 [Phlegmacium glaucopus]|nr:hypothetical protein BYT27DRAFT_7115385 [Phlegmacium glaucopus]